MNYTLLTFMFLLPYLNSLGFVSLSLSTSVFKKVIKWNLLDLFFYFFWGGGGMGQMYALQTIKKLMFFFFFIWEWNGSFGTVLVSLLNIQSECLEYLINTVLTVHYLHKRLKLFPQSFSDLFIYHRTGQIFRMLVYREP